MKNLILKYILFLLLFFVTTKLSASNNPVDVWKEISLKDEMNWLIFSDKFNMKSDNTVYFFVDGQYFSLSSVLDNNNSTCYSDNANTRRVIYTLTNKTSNSIVPVNSSSVSTAGNKLQLQGSNINIANSVFQSTSHPGVNLSSSTNSIQGLSLAPNSSFVFSCLLLIVKQIQYKLIYQLNMVQQVLLYKLENVYYVQQLY